MGLDETYSKIEDKYYAFLDGIEKKGIPVYSVVDPIEHAGIPSLPLFVGIIILLFGLCYYYWGGGIAIPMGGQDIIVTITSKADGSLITGAQVVAKLEGDEIALAESVDGKAVLKNLPKDERIVLMISKPGCTSFHTSITPSEKQSIEIVLQCGEIIVTTACPGISVTSEMETTYLQDINGVRPKSCEVRIYPQADPDSYIENGWKVIDGTLHLSDPDFSKCPEVLDTVEIICNNGEYSGSISSLLTAVRTGNILILQNATEEPETVQNLTADVIRDVVVHVESMDGNPLEGIIIKAVNAEAEPLNLNFNNILLESTTGSTGNTMLEIPDGQYFYIAAEDPKGVYNSYFDEDGEYMADLGIITSVINIQMDKGSGTTITIKETGTQEPITGATVTVVDSEGKHVGYHKLTDSKGETSFVLFAGQTYSVEARHRMYEPANQTITGGNDIVLYLNPVDITKTGNLAITTIKSHGAKDRIGGVNIQLMRNEKVYSETTTSSSGEAYLTNILAGEYTLKLLPPGGANYQEGPSVTIAAQNTTNLIVEVTPEQIKLEVVTYVYMNDKKIPKKGVRVELWDATYEEKVAERESDVERKVTFNIDKCSEVYLVMSYTATEAPYEGRKYGPLTSTPETYCTSKEIRDLVLKEKSDQTKVELEIVSPDGDITDMLEPGEKYYALLSVALPEYTRENIYQQVTVEMFTGKTGYLENAEQTPVLIEKLYLTDIAVQDPYIASLYKSDEYKYGETPPEDKDGPSKYLKIVIGKYTAGTYVARIPIYVRTLANKGDTVISYRATWTTPEGDLIYSQGGNWDEKELEVVPEGTPQFYELESGSFYGYKSWLTSTKYGEPLVNEAITQNSYFYLHIDAMTREDIENWGVSLQTIPDIAQPVAYDGTIIRSSGMTTEISSTEISGTQIINTIDLYNLERDDNMLLTITLKAKAPGKASLIVFRDVRHTLSFEVSEIPALQKETVISGITATLSAMSQFEAGDMYAETKYCNYDVEEEILPTNNKEFKLIFQFHNNQDTDKSIKLYIDATDKTVSFNNVNIGGAVQTGTGTHIQTAEFGVPPDGTELIVTGRGTTQTTSDMNIFVYEQDAIKPIDPWTTIQYGKVDYYASIKAYEEGSILNKVNENTDEVRVWVYKKEDGAESAMGGGDITNDQVQLQYGGHSPWAHLEDEGPYFRYLVPENEPIKATLKAIITSDKFAKIIEEEDVSYVTFDPSGQNILKFTGLSLPSKQEETQILTITSYYEETLGMNIGILEKDGWEITQETTPRILKSGTTSVYMDKETVPEATNIMIPAKGQVEIKITAKPIDVKCRWEGNALLQLEIDKIRKPFVYAFTMSCTGADTGINYTFPGVQTYIVRSDTHPSKIERFDCFNNTLENGKESSYICDAEQLGAVILEASQKLYDDPHSVRHSYQYTLGVDQVDFTVLDEVLKKHDKRWEIGHIYSNEQSAKDTDTFDVVMENKIECGVTNITLEKFNYDQDILVTIGAGSMNPRWCGRTGHAYLVGLLNHDQNIRPNSGRYYSFDQAGQNNRLIEAIQLSKTKGNNVTNTLLFSYDSAGEIFTAESITSTPSRLGGTPQSYIKYKDCDSIDTADCPIFALNEFENQHEVEGEIIEEYKDLYPIIGYFDIDSRDNVDLGLIYDKTRVTTDVTGNQLDSYRALFLTRVLQYSTKGLPSNPAKYGWVSSSANTQMIYVPGKDEMKEELIDLSPIDLVVALYGTDDEGNYNYEITGNRTVYVNIQMSELPEYCKVGDLLPGGNIEYKTDAESKKDDFTDNVGNTDYPIGLDFEWELPPSDGRKRLAVYCVDERGITSPIAIGQIRVDTSGLQLISRKPKTIALYRPMLHNGSFPPFLVRSKYADISNCWIKLSHGEPTEGLMGHSPPTPIDRPEEICGNGRNDYQDMHGIPEEYHKDDGCCVWAKVSDTSAGEYHYFDVWQVNCSSPVIEETDTYVDAEFLCADNLGHENSLATFQLYRWDTDVPRFELPYDFIVSVNGTEEVGTWKNKGGTGLYFGKDNEIVWKPDSSGGPHRYQPLNTNTSNNSHIGTGYLVRNSTENQATLHDVREMNGYREFELIRESEKMYRFKFGANDSDGFKDCTSTSNPGTPKAYPATCHIVGDTKVIVNCSLELHENQVNPVNITCTDKIGKGRSQIFNITLDEKPPEVNWGSFNMTAMGALSGNKREGSPTITFTVTDEYAGVKMCMVAVRHIAPGALAAVFDCDLSGTDRNKKATCEIMPTVIITDLQTNPALQKVKQECSPLGQTIEELEGFGDLDVATEEEVKQLKVSRGKCTTTDSDVELFLESLDYILAKPRLSPVAVRYGTDALLVSCEDEVENEFTVIPVDDEGNQLFEGLKAPPIDKMPEDIIDLCRIIHEGAPASELRDKYYLDLSNQDNPEAPDGVYRINNGGSPELDAHGIALEVHYGGMDSSGANRDQWTREDLVKAVGDKTDKYKIPRAPDCIAAVTVDTALTLIPFIGQAYAAVKETGKILSRETLKLAIKGIAKGFKTKFVSGITWAARPFRYATMYRAATAFKWVFRVRAVFRSIYYIKTTSGIIIQPGTTQEMRDAMDQAVTDSYAKAEELSSECSEHPGNLVERLALGFPIANMLTALTTPDSLQTRICTTPTLPADTTYTIVVMPEKIDLSSAVGEEISVILEPCDDFECRVGILKHPSYVGSCEDGDCDDDGVKEYTGKEPCKTGETDCEDNCPNKPNGPNKQVEIDADRDGKPDILAVQQDTDKDGEGDVCDDDIDGDGAKNYEDDAPYDKDVIHDADGDGIDDADEDDSDDDGVDNDGNEDGDTEDYCKDGETDDCDDNCILIPNSDQTDSDGDCWGDPCDKTTDADGNVIDWSNDPDKPTKGGRCP